MKYLLLLLLLTSCAQIEFTPYNEGLPKTGEWRTNLAIGDVNNDGLLDLAAIGRKTNAGVWIQDNDWKLSAEGIPQTQQCGVGVSLGDVNNDGNLDVAFAQHCGGPIVYLGDGKGNWKNHSTGLSTENVDAIALADLDEDGKLEAITLGAFLKGYKVYKNTGNWTEINTTLPKIITANAYQILTKDINNDGKTDIISTGGKIHVFLNKGNFTFEDKTLQEQAFYTFAAAEKEYIAASTPTQLLVYKNYELYKNITCGKGGMAFADMNDDEEIDLIASCDKIRTFLGPTFKEVKNNIPLVNGTPYGLIAEDINKNKKIDVIAAYDSGIHAWVQ